MSIILIPIIFDDELEADDFEDDAQTKFDKNLKLKLISELTRDCQFSINMSEILSFKVFLKSLREAIVDVIPIKDESEIGARLVENRFIDNNRPMNFEEENFFKCMKIKELELVNSKK